MSMSDLINTPDISRLAGSPGIDLCRIRFSEQSMTGPQMAATCVLHWMSSLSAISCTLSLTHTCTRTRAHTHRVPRARTDYTERPYVAVEREVLITVSSKQLLPDGCSAEYSRHKSV